MRRAAVKIHLCEVHEVLEAGVQVGLLLERADVLEVGVVYVGIHPEEALEDCADDLLEAGREGLPIVLREDAGIVHLQCSSDSHAIASAMTLIRLPVQLLAPCNG